jgi:hypothetical protein
VVPNHALYQAKLRPEYAACCLPRILFSRTWGAHGARVLRLAASPIGQTEFAVGRVEFVVMGVFVNVGGPLSLLNSENTCSFWRSKFHIRNRSDCPPKLLIEVCRSEVFNHISKGIECEFPTVRPIDSESLVTSSMLFDPSGFDHQVKCVRNIFFGWFRFIWHKRG